MLQAPPHVRTRALQARASTLQAQRAGRPGLPPLSRDCHRGSQVLFFLLEGPSKKAEGLRTQVKGSQAVGQEPPGRPHAARGQQSHADPPAPPQLPRRPSPKVPQTTECWGTATAPPTRHSCGTKTGPDLQTGPSVCRCQIRARREGGLQAPGRERTLPSTELRQPAGCCARCLHDHQPSRKQPVSRPPSGI